MTEREREILEKTIDVLKRHVDPQTIYLFGSRKTKTNRKGSDFDFAVSSPQPGFETQRGIEDAIEEFIGLYRIDIVYLDSVEPDFRDLILHQGRIVYEK